MVRVRVRVSVRVTLLTWPKFYKYSAISVPQIRPTFRLSVDLMLTLFCKIKKNSVELRPQADDCTFHTSLIHLCNGVGTPICYFGYQFHKTVRTVQSGKQFLLIFVRCLTSQSV